MKKKELLALADYMELVDAAAYDQSSWLDRLKPDKILGIDQETGAVRLSEDFCGTSACVLGHAVFAPALKHLGLFLNLRPSFSSERESDTVTIDGTRYLCRYPEICTVDDDGHVVEGFETACIAFDIPEDHAEVIFGPNTADTRFFYLGEEGSPDDLTPTVVASALRDYVATNGERFERNWDLYLEWANRVDD